MRISSKVLLSTLLATMLFANPLLAQPEISEDTRLAISLEIPSVQTSNRYRNPFVAVWLEDMQGTGVTTLSVWYNRARWLPDLSQWWRKIGRVGEQAYDSVTGATQRPGNYLLQWDGTTVQGDVVPDGEYYLIIEVAREHGGTERVRLTVNLGASGSGSRAQGETELGQVQALVI